MLLLFFRSGRLETVFVVLLFLLLTVLSDLLAEDISCVQWSVDEGFRLRGHYELLLILCQKPPFLLPNSLLLIIFAHL